MKPLPVPPRIMSTGRLVLATVVIVLNASSTPGAAQRLSDSAVAQISALEDEKASFSPPERKMDSQLVFALKRRRQEAIAKNAVPFLRVEDKADADGMVDVDISASITSNLLRQIEICGGQLRDDTVSSPVCARLPMDQLKKIASLPEVKLIDSALRTRPNVIDSDGIISHDAALAWSSFGVNGGNVKVGVISDSIDSLAAAQAANDLGPVAVLPGQSGVPGTGEGTALLEIVHAMAPGAQLFFATGTPSIARFASNILSLRFQYGCDIILDDITIEQETPFQDGAIAQAIVSVRTNGALYLSAAGNEGNFYNSVFGQGSGVWEGDFADNGAASAPLRGKGRIHRFGASDSDKVTSQSLHPLSTELFWSDPWGASDNDYDLFVLDAKGSNVVASSINVQNGGQNPFEAVPAPKAGESLVVVLARGEGRFLHLTTQGARLARSTPGAVRGHNASTNALTVGAFDRNVINGVEPFSSDGPRQMFYYADGTPITPGNVSSSGGAVFQKPDLSGADGVPTSVFNPFYGTSAGVANVAGVAALLKSFNPSLAPSELQSILETNALVGPAGPSAWDQYFGYGSPEADLSISAAPAYTGGPTIPMSPASQHAVLGAAFALNVTAFGDLPLTYLWQKNGTNLADGGEYSGSSTSNLTIACNFLGDAGSYSVIVSNSQGQAASMAAVIDYAPVQMVGSLDSISNYNGGYYFTEPGLTQGSDGNFYGSVTAGGNQRGGSLFSLTPSGAVRELFDLSQFPNALVRGEDGGLYGTTQGDGISSSGEIFRWTPGGEFDVLYTFTSGFDGAFPLCGLTPGKNGVFYGTAFYGGASGSGTIYEITASGQFTTLYAFYSAPDSGNPAAAPVMGNDGFLYGTTVGSASSIAAGGTPGAIYKLSPDGATALYTFTNGLDGATPWAGLTLGPDGNFYGVASSGGALDEFGNTGGTLYRISTNGTFKVLHAFSPLDGTVPLGKLALGTDGNFYGTTTAGGPGYVIGEETMPDGGGMPYGNGTIFRMTPAGDFTVLYSFTAGADGASPAADLFAASDGNIYGIDAGSYFAGIPTGGNVFRIMPNGFGPAITLGPRNQVVARGSNASFSVSAGGAPPLAFQWQFKGANIAGATNSSVVVTNVQPRQAGEYRVVIKNSFASVISSNASLSLGMPVVISRQPQGRTVALGASVSLSVAASGTPPLAYQWQINGSNIPGATRAALSISHVNNTNAGTYSVLVSNPINTAAGSNAVLSISVPARTAASPRTSFQLLPSMAGPIVVRGLFLDTNNISAQSAGSVSLAVSRTRAFAGKITRALGVDSFSGQFDHDGTAQISLPASKTGPVELRLRLGSGPGAPFLGGVVRNSGVFNAPLAAWPVSSNSAQMCLPASAFAITSSGASAGFGYGFARITDRGNVIARFSLVDGTTFVTSAPVLQNGEWPVFAPLYDGKGWFISWDSVSSAGIAGSAVWLRANSERIMNLSLAAPKNDKP